MNTETRARVEHLGQTGLRIDLEDLIVLVDPYLSHSVQELDAPDLMRQVPIPYQPHELSMVDWVLITHEHMDHCDPHTLPVLAQASPQARFIGPLAVRKQLEQWGISGERIMQAPPNAFDLGAGLSVQAIPAAHPRIRFDQDGQPQAVGYLFQHDDRSLYLAGDTCVCDISTASDAVFTNPNDLPTQEQVESELHIGAPAIAMFDSDTYTLCTTTACAMRSPQIRLYTRGTEIRPRLDETAIFRNEYKFSSDT